MIELPTIIIDTREQRPWAFDDLHIRGIKSLPTVRGTLRTGDYSIQGLEDLVCIERKSAEDLYGTLVGGHDRFSRELERMRAFKYKYLVIESSPTKFIKYVDHWRDFGKLDTIIQSLCAWPLEFGVKPRWCKDRDSAMDYVARLALHIYGEENQGREKCPEHPEQPK